MKQKILLFIVLCVGVSCSSGRRHHRRPHHKKTRVKQSITVNIQKEPETLEAGKIQNINDANVAYMLMDGLMRVDQSGLTKPAITQKFHVSEDFSTYTFSLKETNWSNGDPLTAHDFVYAWKKMLDPGYSCSAAEALFCIKHAKSIKRGDLPSSFLGVYAIDDYTLRVEMEKPTPHFLEMLTLPVFQPIPSQIDQHVENWTQEAETFVCNGPFKMQYWDHNEEIVIVKNQNYWDENQVSLDEIHLIMLSSEAEYALFEEQKIDWTGAPFSQIPADYIALMEEENKLHRDPLLGTYWVRTNTELFPLHSKELRKSLALAIDREEIISQVSDGQKDPATGIVPLSLGLQNTQYFANGNFEQAQEFLHVALEKENFSRLPQITLSYISDSNNHKIAQTLQQQWKAILNLAVKLEPLQKDVYFDRIAKGDYQLACGSWVADFRDPINFLEIFKTETETVGWESLNYQKAIESSYLAATETDRKEALQKSEEILMEEMPVVPIYHHAMVHAQNERLDNVLLLEQGRVDFKWACLRN